MALMSESSREPCNHMDRRKMSERTRRGPADMLSRALFAQLNNRGMFTKVMIGRRSCISMHIHMICNYAYKRRSSADSLTATYFTHEQVHLWCFYHWREQEHEYRGKSIF